MPEQEPIYDLMLMLAPELPSEERDELVAGTESAIEAGGGVIELAQDWGVRGLAYEIGHKAQATYYLIQFSGSPELLDSLGHRLRIADGVVRHRIIKVAPGTQPPVPATAAPPEDDAEADQAEVVA